MTDQTGGQPPAGWYPDGSGQVRYWDGATWTEHVQPEQPEAPAADAAAAQQPAAAAATGAVGGAAVGGAAAAAAGPVHAEDTWNTAAASDPQPFYKKPAGLAVIAVVLLLVIAGAAFALTSGGGSDDGGSAATATTSATPAAQPTAARKVYTLNCEPVSKIEGSNAAYPFNLILTVSPTDISVSANASIRNTGPTTIEVGKYQFDAIVTVNGTPLTLTGPTNKETAPGDTGGKQPIFKQAELPLIAKAPIPAGTTGTPTVVLQDIYFNNINTEPTATAALTDTFDSRCNTSPQPNAAPAPIGLSVPPTAAGAAPAPSVAGSVAPQAVPSVASSVTP